MSDASQFPVTEGFGCQPGYPLNTGVCPPGQGYHNGIDYGCPSGTSIVVNGVVIGISGATGYVTGPHLHVGRWVGGVATNPGVGGGFHFASAMVTGVSEDATNGKYVRVQGDGASWVYLHMSDNSKVKIGQILQGGNVSDNTQLALDREQYLARIGAEVSVNAPIDSHAVDQIIANIRTLYAQNNAVTQIAEDRLNQIKQLQSGATGDYVPVTEQLYEKKV